MFDNNTVRGKYILPVIFGGLMFSLAGLLATTADTPHIVFAVIFSVAGLMMLAASLSNYMKKSSGDNS